MPVLLAASATIQMRMPELCLHDPVMKHLPPATVALLDIVVAAMAILIMPTDGINALALSLPTTCTAMQMRVIELDTSDPHVQRVATRAMLVLLVGLAPMPEGVDPTWLVFAPCCFPCLPIAHSQCRCCIVHCSTRDKLAHSIFPLREDRLPPLERLVLIHDCSTTIPLNNERCRFVVDSVLHVLVVVVFAVREHRLPAR
mmetsp:Transcript_10660/g.24727  ORF Transcript_10660/g.24727 Transcript_10660/m.24727 type:complete len:200 (-) Transcript_10660:187-786(-)|eukprot:CAMPEP_0119367190 /NCGR_PEP_ID=MMETSP1334-20130426/14009_1 /TAXON_ID=127549 /ORGANISM="Calcidiscus leptoporus, Strain RCC1130" /LENGTH=199 /DNA_ID=CAMNT_0007383557 /DNA_START=178 /DNA_END=777 /DNA_ORIENTATION=-